ncbi:MAG: hypothetical protein KDA81_08575 [Planctomycetaceae bacterium]|nr:hypothetical protein [Planctomycetaceae bacterium]
MASPAATKASDKQQALKKLTGLLQKDYGKSLPKLKLPVVETMLFAVCLEDNNWELAETGYQKLLKSFFDLNEIRVSSVGELEATLSGLNHADWKGLRIRSILRFVFESTYSFDFEKLIKLNLESAQKRLRKIEFISPFITNFTLQQCLGCHVVCLDEYSLRAAKHLGIVPPDADIEAASEFLKGGLKKADTFGFSHLLRCLATDPKFTARLATSPEETDFDVLKVAERYAALKLPPKKTAAKKAPKAPAPPKAKKSAGTAAAKTSVKAAPKGKSAPGKSDKPLKKKK